MVSVKLFVADDHQLMREGIIRMLNDVKGIEIIGTASDGKEAYSKIIELKPDLVLIDISMPGMRGDEVINLVRKKKNLDRIKFLLMSADEIPFLRNRSFYAGADGFIQKDSKKEDVLEAIRNVTAGGKPGTQSAGEQGRADCQGQSVSGYSSKRNDDLILTRREKEILERVRKGIGEKRIARELSITRETVVHYKITLCIKLGVENPRALFSFVGRDAGISNLLHNM